MRPSVGSVQIVTMRAAFGYLDLERVVVAHSARGLLQHLREDAVARPIDGQQAVIAAVVHNFTLQIGLANAAANVRVAHSCITVSDQGCHIGRQRLVGVDFIEHVSSVVAHVVHFKNQRFD